MKKIFIGFLTLCLMNVLDAGSLLSKQRPPEKKVANPIFKKDEELKNIAKKLEAKKRNASSSAE
jgi:hypothetical protein